MPGARPEGRGRKPREQGQGAVGTTAPAVSARPEAARLLEAILDRENMMAAYRRVVGNAGAAGVDGMSVGELGAFLAGALAAHQGGPAGRPVSAAAGAPGGDPEARRRQPHPGDPHGARPADPAGAASGAVTALRPGFFGGLVWLPAGAECPPGGAGGARACGGGRRFVVDIDLEKDGSDSTSGLLGSCLILPPGS